MRRPGYDLFMAQRSGIALFLAILLATLGCCSRQGIRVDSERLYSEAEYGEDRFVQVSGYNLHYVEVGQGEPVILIPGSFSTYRCWNRVMPLLFDHYRLYALDYVGTGDSDKPRKGFRYTVEEQADLTAMMIKKLELGKVNLVGISYGGVIVLNLAARYPELVNKVVSIEGSVIIPERPGGFDMMQYMFVWPIGCCTIGVAKTGLLNGLFVRLIAGKWYPYMTHQDREEMREELHYNTQSATRVSWYWQSVSPMTSANFEEEAKTISAPILYLYGEQSDFAEMVEENIEFFELYLPDVRIVGFEDGIHDLEFQKPQEVAELIMEFLSEDDQ